MEGNIHAQWPRGRSQCSHNSVQCNIEELRRRHTFVFHVKQVDIAIDTSPMPFTWRSLPQFSRSTSAKSTHLFSRCSRRMINVIWVFQNIFRMREEISHPLNIRETRKKKIKEKSSENICVRFLYRHIYRISKAGLYLTLHTNNVELQISITYSFAYLMSSLTNILQLCTFSSNRSVVF